MKNLSMIGVHWDIRYLRREGFTITQYIGRNCQKRGATWTVFQILGGYPLLGWYPNQHNGRVGLDEVIIELRSDFFCLIAIGFNGSTFYMKGK